MNFDKPPSASKNEALLLDFTEQSSRTADADQTEKLNRFQQRMLERLSKKEAGDAPVKKEKTKEELA